jgi:hypothetical protein
LIYGDVGIYFLNIIIETSLVPGESIKAVSKLGLVSMKSCIDAYLYTIDNEMLNGIV